MALSFNNIDSSRNILYYFIHIIQPPCLELSTVNFGCQSSLVPFIAVNLLFGALISAWVVLSQITHGHYALTGGDKVLFLIAAPSSSTTFQTMN